ncbi:cation:proton antiporter [Nocardioides sp. LS1]|uniref:cation:proton antiporter n=1 Tax=Nocardioides sp. LS1 TaxID=1027620 RepID=UPI000F617EEA|nr:cation:proton antiporter [Nocardioides sp. LS1]GCD88715.1 hypothetical protein NLS1_07210 [Nocardioides sp. LS1]
MAAHDTQETIALVFLDIAVIVLVARLLGPLVRRLRQPTVVAEILAALALGPSLLGALPGNPTDDLFPPDVRPYLAVVAALGLTIYMFVVGLELDLGLIRGKGATAGTISACSVALPFGLGTVLALWLHGRHDTVAGQHVDLVPFALFLGAAMSVTAFPVLARILQERRMQRTPTGALALACAAVDDVLAWIMLAVVLAIVRSSGGADLVRMVAESVGFVVVMFLVVRPRLRVLVDRRDAAGGLTPDIFAVVLVGVLFSSFLTDRIGIHAIFGAFLFGAAMPRRGAERLSQEILERVEQVTVLLLLPVFFVVTGLNVDVTALGRSGLVELLAVMAVACFGKFLGAAAAARGLGIRSRRAAAIGVLMNTRGLTELVVLNVGLSVGVLDERLFTVMVLMAILTTVMTEPLLRLIYPDRAVQRDILEAERAALGLSAEHRVLVLAEGADAPDGQLVDWGVRLLGTGEDSELVISRIEARPLRRVEVGSGRLADLAAFATSLEATQSLARRATAAGAVVHVHSELADDPVAEARVHAEATGADVVLAAAGSALAAAAAEHDDAVVVTLHVPDAATTVTGVAARVGTTADGTAAVEQAARVAERLGVPLQLVTRGGRRETRRASTLERRLEEAGIAASQTTEDDLLERTGLDGGSLVLVRGVADGPHPAAGTGPVLEVRGSAHDNDERLDAMLTRRCERPRVDQREGQR